MWSKLAIFAAILTLVCIFGLGFKFVRRIRNYYLERYDFLLADYEETVSAAGFISNMLDEDDKPRWKYKDVVETTIIHGDGTCDVIRRYTIEAAENPAQMLKIRIIADDMAEPILFLRNLKFQIKCIGSHNGTVRHLVSLNDHLKKIICIFFLPPIKPNDMRALEIQYTWPNFAANLIERGKTDFFASFESCDADDTAEVRLEFHFASELGEIFFEPDFVMTGGVLKSDNTDPAFNTWIYTHPKMPMAHKKINFHATK
ncbi:MAG: hypothetical protein COA47_05325 [Robiginitomaculum sp.]|nr:MAG: hypothetical protein COA47_05325 [Robiginitomaculum sp.]